MNAILVRVGADRSQGGGFWNGPVDGRTGEFAYVAIPENAPLHTGLEQPYNAILPFLARFGVALPPHLAHRSMHLDPDFANLTYGDQGERGKQLRAYLRPGDLIVFYASLADSRSSARLIYALIGLLVVDRFVLAANVPAHERSLNAHSRRILKDDAHDVIVHGRPRISGRLQRCLPIGEFRDRAYRVRSDVLDHWGGLTVKGGYLQRSARLPKFLNPRRFCDWLERQNPELIQANN